MAILWQFLAIFSPSICSSFTKLRFRRSFWGADWVCTSIGSKVMTKNANTYIFLVLANYKYDYLSKTEVKTIILRWLKSLNLNWFKSYDKKCKYFTFRILLTHEIITTNKCLFYDQFWSFFCQLYVQLSQNWDSDGHFGVLNESKS